MHRRRESLNSADKMAEVEWGAGQPGAPLASSRSAVVVAAARLLQVKYRRDQNMFLAEGPQVVREVLATPGMTTRLFITPAAAQAHSEFVDSAQASAIPVTWCDDGAVKRLAAATTPAGVVAVCRIPQTTAEQVLTGARLAVTLWQANDPGNVGTIIRTADAMGADAVILTPESVDPYNDKCVRSTAGSIAHIPVVTAVEFATLRELASRGGMKVLATAMHGQPLDSAEIVDLLKQPVMWLFGSEAHGLSEDVLAASDAVVAIPMAGHAESLNMAVAAGVCLYASSIAQKGSHT